MAFSEEGRLSRRHFLAAAGLAGGALAAGQGRLFGETTEALATQPLSAAQTRPGGYAMLPFGRTGLKVSVVGFGAIKIGLPTGPRLLKMAIDSGVNVVHTARGYTGGKSVAAIGQLFEEAPEYRKKVVLCLKEDTRVSEDRLDKDLANLHTDHADVYVPQLQTPQQAMMEDAIAAMENLKKKGKIRFGGFTCHQDMNGVCELVLDKAPKGYDCCLISTAMVRPQDSGSKATQEQIERFGQNLKKMRAAGVGVISMKSGATNVVGRGPAGYAAHMRVIAAAGVDTAITSFASVKEIENATNAGLSDLKLTTAAVAAWEQQWLTAGWPCLMCGRCTGACAAGLPVAALMRMAMYREHYRMERHARQEFADLRLDKTRALAACEGCAGCGGVCPVGLASGRKVRQVVEALA